jgi:2-polyprenyl-3-methyl-5-hydroxy-6-metoxy-1,4-benzoquinol methylase
VKRIIGRRMAPDQVVDYSTEKLPVVNYDLLDAKQLPYRVQWASAVIDKAEGFICYHYLDIGTFTGVLPAIVAHKRIVNGLPGQVVVDAIEAHKQAFEAADGLAQAMRARGLKMTVHNCKFEDYETTTKYDVITAFEILEHTRDPLFFVEKIYDLLEIGGTFMLTVPEESGFFGLQDPNPFHYWCSSVQSLISVLFHDEKKWHVRQVFEQGDLIHMRVKKLSYQG